MEKEWLWYVLEGLKRGDAPRAVVEQVVHAFGGQIVYPDPMDLTKMLNEEPGTRPLPGVREMQQLFFP